MKRKISLLLVFVLVLSLFTSSPAYADRPINIYFNNSPLTLDVAPIVEDGRILVPVRPIFEALNCNIQWTQETKTIAAYTEWLYVLEIQLDNPVVTTYFQIPSDDYDYETMTGSIEKENFATLTMDIPAKSIAGRVLVPIRFISEAFGENVEWDGASRCVYIGDCEATKAELKEAGITLYSEDGRTITVQLDQVDENLALGWYESQDAAMLQANREALEKFYIGDDVVLNLFVIIKYGVIQEINYDTGQVPVEWYHVSDGINVPLEGFAGILYGLYSSEWMPASALM